MPQPELRIAHVELQVPGSAMDALARFYGEELGLPGEHRRHALSVAVGGAELVFTPAAGDARPFYHFALLVPGDRFDAARSWIARHTQLLAGEDGAAVFDFADWNAEACYFHDPAANIVELIAHHGVGDRPQETGGFCATELIGISELGIVVANPASAAEVLHRELGLALWSGAVDDTGGLGFVGRQAHTLILTGAGRGWLPTGRPAERHPVAVTITGGWEQATEPVQLAAAPNPILVRCARG
jgi:catechol-2,3-dioxygenase